MTDVGIAWRFTSVVSEQLIMFKAPFMSVCKVVSSFGVLNLMILSAYNTFIRIQKILILILCQQSFVFFLNLFWEMLCQNLGMADSFHILIFKRCKRV